MTEEDWMQSLVGRTITRVRDFDESPKDEWAHHGTFWLWLDDGRVIEFSSWGYDADGATVDEIEVAEVTSCMHCRKNHGPMKVFTSETYMHPEMPQGTKYAYCTNGNSIGWRP